MSRVMAVVSSAADTVLVVVGRTGVVSTSPARLRAARRAATPTAEELAARRRRYHSPGITQAELAARLGHATPGAVNQWECGRHRLDVESLAAVAAALRVDPLELLEPGTPVTLQLLRIRAGLTQAALAKRLGMSRTTWSAIESGHRDLLRDEWETAAAALGVSLTKVVTAAGAGPQSAPRVEELPADLVERLTAHQRPGETLSDTIARLIPPAPTTD